MIIKVERKIYNTETAELIAETAQGSYGDSCGFEEKLYKRGPGDYFIFGHGGESSPYPQPGLFVLSVQDARAWLERVAGSDAVEREFNPVKKPAVKKAIAKKAAAPKVPAVEAIEKPAARKTAAKKALTAETLPKAEKPPKAEKAPKVVKTPKTTKAPKA